MTLALRGVLWTPDGEAAFDCQRATHGIHLDIVTGFDEVPSVRGTDTIIPAAAGVRPGSRVAHLRDIDLAGFVSADDGDDDPLFGLDLALASYEANMLELQAAFDPTKTGVLRVIGADGATYTIPARPLSTVYSPQANQAFRLVSVALVSTTNPYWTRTPAGS